ncbi:hypothetical protein C0995_002739 [Termitomyces sp. Mi166|nr:hypothetical protein C0995_002739 [Termitomyces sp. Mi166\
MVALLVNLNILILAFAAWSASAAARSGISVSVATVFSIIESCALFIGVILYVTSSRHVDNSYSNNLVRGTAEFVVSRVNTARVIFECIWTAILSVCQTGTAISATVNVFEVCRSTDNWESCASSSLLIPTSWLSSIILFAYFVALFITAIAYVPLIPEIWTQSIYSMDWFSLRGPNSKCEKVALETDTWSRYIKDIEATGSRSDDSAMHAPWAKTIRRGIDPPFKSSGLSAASSPSTTTTSLPVAPLRIQSRNIAGSRFIERFRESARLSRRENVSQIQSTGQNQVNPFPPRVEDYDLPIPLPRLSEWIRADDIKGINVHDNAMTP